LTLTAEAINPTVLQTLISLQKREDNLNAVENSTHGTGIGASPKLN
jgi:hypothetical protein